ncbi:LysR family transcriptional regulator [Psychrobacter sp. FDAARGOS_221]|uniref:LysR family transcriptional regulator n=1 Tax=Psychrobacter sp. FDAARGOS_221 TaxID=1975705 RepID=UPI000BB5899A|nr:LysR family transcriptional regulator [Psychrobacter sp. FDAARGOS_221]PNK59812.1 LysR family transcriptional regulator [Psychrobacter sp. FDAARGOS_221]
MNKTTLHGLLLNMAIFETVADLGSFSAAAEALQMTPSSVSKRITQLEDTLGTRLIERTTRSMRLTGTGGSFLTYCQNMLKEANAAVEVANQSLEVLAGDVSIGVPKSFASHVMGGLLVAFLKQYPDIRLKAVITDNSIDLLRDNVDCAIEISESPPDYLIAKPLREVRQVLCATPQYLASHPYPIKHPLDLKHHDCIYLGETPDDNQWRFLNINDKTLEPITVTVSGRYAVNHTGMRLEGVVNHLGVGCFPDFVVTEALSSGTVVEVLPDWQLKSKYEGVAWLTYLPNKFRPLRLQVLIEFLQD